MNSQFNLNQHRDPNDDIQR